MTSVFFTHFRPRTKRQAGQVWTHLLFLRPAGAAKTLVGEPPQTRHFGTKCPKARPVPLRLLSPQNLGCWWPAAWGGPVSPAGTPPRCPASRSPAHKTSYPPSGSFQPEERHAFVGKAPGPDQPQGLRELGERGPQKKARCPGPQARRPGARTIPQCITLMRFFADLTCSHLWIKELINR